MTHVSSILTRAIAIVCIIWLALTALPSLPVAGQSATPTPDIEQLLDVLTGNDMLAAERAAQQLALSGTAAAVPRLIDIFRTSDTPRLAATALGGIGTQQATQTLAGALTDDPLTARRNAAQIGLLYGGEQAIDTLVSTLRVPQVPARRHAAELLGYLSSPLALNGLLRAAQQDAAPSVRQSAVWALSEIDSPRVRPALVAISVRDVDPDVRTEAESALLRLDQRYR
ncbi:MAG TPA: HEAT repeat domain-containing protein [Anaerolineae bacterium]|nr:HEAT repeat domain-containing protein [Anaerolineae bacterium]